MTDISETKKKIIDAASALFASNGYSGTSIRDIAKKASVNLAAINYHFQNKQNLYCEVFERNYQWLEIGIKELSQTVHNTRDFSWELYLFFIANGPALMNSFKMLLNDNIPIPDDYYAGEALKEFGPPGGEILKEFILKDVSEEIYEEAIQWAVTAIFTHLVHMAILMSTAIIKKRCEKIATLSDEHKKRRIMALVDSVLNHLKLGNESWEQLDEREF